MPTFLTDTFTATDGTLLTAHTSDSGHGWLQHPLASGQGTITSGRVYPSTGGIVYADAVPPDPVYTVSYDHLFLTSAGAFSVLGRLVPDALTFYMVRYYTGQWQILKFVAGTQTAMSSSTLATPTGTAVHVEIAFGEGSQVVTVDEVEVLATTDNDVALQGAGRIGFRDFATTSPTTGKHVGMIQAATPGAASGRIFPVVKIGQSQRIGPLKVG